MGKVLVDGFRPLCYPVDSLAKGLERFSHVRLNYPRQTCEELKFKVDKASGSYTSASMIILLIPFVFWLVCWLGGLSLAGWFGIAATLETFDQAVKAGTRKKTKTPQPAEPSISGLAVLAILVIAVLGAAVLNP
jgi:hypothetical protein